MLEPTQPSSSGAKLAPAAVALEPRTACKNSGTKVTPPKSDQPASKPLAQAIANMRSRNSASGSTGSAARRSTQPSATNSSAALPSSAQPTGVPSSNSPSNSTTIPTVSSAAPA